MPNIVRELANIATINQNESLLWPQLEIFYTIPLIKSLSNYEINMIKGTIKRGDLDSLYDTVESILVKNKIDKTVVDDYLYDKRLHDLDSVLSQIIEKKPSVEELQTCYNFDAKCFKNKTIRIVDPLILDSYFGTILEGIKNDKELTLLMNDKSIIVVQMVNGAVTVIHKTLVTYKFLHSILYFDNLRDGTFSIEESDTSTHEIQTGDYKIGYHKLNKDIRVKNFYKGETTNVFNLDVEIINQTDCRKKYMFKILYTDTENVKVESLQIDQWDASKNEYIIMQTTLDHNSIDFKYHVCKYATKVYQGINAVNYSRQIQIKEEVDELGQKIKKS